MYGHIKAEGTTWSRHPSQYLFHELAAHRSQTSDEASFIDIRDEVEWLRRKQSRHGEAYYLSWGGKFKN